MTLELLYIGLKGKEVKMIFKKIKTYKCRISFLVSIVLSCFLLSSCNDASASNGSASALDSTAQFRLTRTAIQDSSTLAVLDAQCRTEFGSQYMTATSFEAKHLVSSDITRYGVYTYGLNPQTGIYSPECNNNNGSYSSPYFCAVLCIKK